MYLYTHTYIYISHVPVIIYLRSTFVSFHRKVKSHESPNTELQNEKPPEVCKRPDDHVFLKPAEPKSVIESKGSTDYRQKVSNLVCCNILLYKC